MDDKAKLIWEKTFFRISSLTNDMQDPKINSPPHRDWQLLSPWLKQKQIIFITWQWWEISQVLHLTTGNRILNSYTWNNSLQQVFFQDGKIYNHHQADLYVQKFHIHLLSKTLVSKIDPKNGLLSMEHDYRATLALSRCHESNRINVSSIRAMVMILWHVESHLLQDFRDTCWIPTQGIEWKLCMKKLLYLKVSMISLHAH